VALNNLGLGFVFTARDLASGTITRVGGAFGAMDRNALRAQQSYQRNFAVMGAGLAIMGAGAATLAGAFGLAEVAGHFEQELARVGGIAQASAEDLTEMRAAAIRAGALSGFSPVQATEALGALASQGFNAQQSIRLLDPALTLAAGGMISAEQASMSLAAATHVFGLSMDEAALAGDQMLRISNSTALAAGDMELAIGTVARGARLTDQTITEMLPSIGLLRNTGVDVSVASQSVSSALTFMSSRATEIKQALGVDLVETLEDGTQRFRPFMDIAMEAGTALEERFANPAERAAIATELFSRFGVGAVTGVFDTLRNGVRDSEGTLYQGAAAIAFLRSEMTDAAGAAEEFRNRLLDTYEGQQQLVGAAASTLGILLGEGFTRGLRPYVEGTLAMLQRVIGFIEEIPMEVRGAIASVIIAAGGLTFAFGALIAFGAALAIIAPFLEAIALSTLGLLAAMAPFAAAAATLMGLVYAFGRLIASSERFRMVVGRAVEVVRLAFRGLVQLFTTGELTGAVAQALSEPRNEGLLRFLIDVYAIGFRVVQFFRGIGAGFEAALGTLGPSIDRMLGSFERLAITLGLVSAEGREAVAGMPSSEFMKSGASIGLMLANALELIVNGLAGGAEFARDFTEGFTWLFGTVTPGLDALSPSLSFLWEQLTELLVALGVMSENGTDASGNMMTFGRVLGIVVAAGVDFLIFSIAELAYILGGVLFVGRHLVQFFMALPTVMAFVGKTITTVFENIADGFMMLIERMIAGVGSLASMVPPELRPASLDALIASGDQARQRADARSAAIEGRTDTLRRGYSPFTAGADAEHRAAAEERQDASMGAVAGLLREQAAARDAQPWNVTLEVDGEALGRATGRGQQRDAAASYGSTPVED
jgi:TP901 family phage tail tape measure protein